MTDDTLRELADIELSLGRLIARCNRPDVREPLQRLGKAAKEIGKAWSGSWTGYHANVYYRDLQPPPPGAHFSTEWGGMESSFLKGTTGPWTEYDRTSVVKAIYRLAGNPNMTTVETFNRSAGRYFDRAKNSLLSIIDIELSSFPSEFLATQKAVVAGLTLLSESELITAISPSSVSSRDSLAVYQGIQVPPHIEVLAKSGSVETTIQQIEKLAELLRQIIDHVRRVYDQTKLGPSVGHRVFIGHGHSSIWRELKDFLEDQLNLQVDEFNRIPIAGRSTIERLQEMLESAAFAFLVMTGEDIQLDGRRRARENVVHEAGLFQGRLGFTRAIVLLEDRCDEFSNIAGLGHIRFARGNIRATFQEVRQVLEREGIYQNQG